MGMMLANISTLDKMTEMHLLLDLGNSLMKGIE